MSDNHRTGKRVQCTLCGKDKAPLGRSISDATSASYCHYTTCEGYTQEPKPDTLFPGETND